MAGDEMLNWYIYEANMASVSVNIIICRRRDDNRNL